MEKQITLNDLRKHLSAGAGMWSARTSDADHGDDDTHLAAWAWVERPRDVELAGATVQVSHPDYAGGDWVTVAESTGAVVL